ncbi:YqiA/YcfP family alpha/beta fold hydrolase [Tateyamaria pelophila]|uniref:YqiA/YcfP family alpha/beta fold hydrolase n=1 Tax=Tateyamaria pelophila TaxID=328415 RepID=UPI001CBE640E|nr:YqiA/YcfP family alpha/beta fold hydrolase [Tateyamaria pelophila]
MGKIDRPAVDQIMYCHGFASNFDPQKDKVKALSMLAPVQGVTVDYTCPPEKVFEAFAAELQGPSRTLIVGTSMGGFLAAWLGSAFNLPFIAINPAVSPATSLQKYLGRGQTHFGTPYDLKKEVVRAYQDIPFRLDGPGEIVLDLGDEVINPQKTLAMVANQLPVTTFEGGSHRFDHMVELVKILAGKFDLKAPSPEA